MGRWKEGEPPSDKNPLPIVLVDEDGHEIAFNSFATVVTSGSPDAVADGEDTLTFVAGSNITITIAGNSLTINSTASGSGSVTEVDTGTGLTGGPITSTGTIALADTAVTPGNFTNANITVDQQGRITAATSGSTGGTVSLVTDADADTQINVELSADEDIIHFNTGDGTAGYGAKADAMILSSGLFLVELEDAAAASDATGGTITLFASAGDGLGDGGQLNWATGAGGDNGNGGDAQFITGSGGLTGDRRGGDLTVQTGAGSNAGRGGDVSFLGGSGGGSGVGGSMAINAGDGAQGGSVTITSGGGNGSVGGDMTFTAGSSSSGDQNGGNLSFFSGDGDGAGGGGTINFNAGGGADLGGDVRLNSGSGASSNGRIRLSVASNDILTLQTSAGVDADAFFGGTAAVIVPNGDDSQRPSSPANGMIRYNSTGDTVEAYFDGQWNSWSSGGGSGTVTQVDTGTGLTGGPITTTGTINLADTLVTPGSYTYASITVDQQGRLTAASSGTAPPVTSVFGRSGAVTAQTGDYTAAQVTGAVPDTITLTAGAGISGGGDLSTNRSFDITLADWGATAAASGDSVLFFDLSNSDAPASRTFGNVISDLGIVLGTRVITAGTGLTGGGNLTADRTIALADTLVTPGSYTYANITVDQQGRLTAASSGTTPATLAFKTIAVATQSDVVADSATDTLTLVAGTNVTITTDAATDSITINASDPTLAFKTIAVATQSDVVADSATDTLTLVAGTGMAITTDASTDTITTTLANTAVTPGSYTYANFTVDQQGRLTVAGSGAAPALAATTLTAGAGISGGGDLSSNRSFDITLADWPNTAAAGADEFLYFDNSNSDAPASRSFTNLVTDLGIAMLANANGFTADQTITINSSSGTALRLTNTDAGATGPILFGRHNSATPAANDVIFTFNAEGNNDTPAIVTYSRIRFLINTTTTGAEDGDMRFDTLRAGTIANRMSIGAGVYDPNATGTDKGAGTINFGTVYQNNVLVVTQARTLTAGAALTGTGDLSADRTFAVAKAGTGMADVATVAGDAVMFFDASAADAPKWRTWTNIISDLGLATGGPFVSAARTLTAGAGISGGGDLSADRTFDITLADWANTAAASADEVLFFDNSNSDSPASRSFANIFTDLKVVVSTGTPPTITVTAGTGVAATGGDWNLTAGTGGTSDNTGGAANIVGGAGGATNGAGGSVNITSGAGAGSGAGGTTNVLGGPGGATGASGSVNISAGLPTDANSGQVNLRFRDAVGTNHSSGSISIGTNATAGFEGLGTGSGSNGKVLIQGAGGKDTVNTATQGQVLIRGGRAAPDLTTAAGAKVIVKGGDGGSTSGNAAGVDIVGGVPVSGNGAPILIQASDGVGTTKNGGTVTITAGAKTSGGTDGLILMKAGAAVTYVTVQEPGAANASVVFAGTNAITVPVGTDAQRPSSPTAGMLRYNTDADTDALEYYDAQATAEWAQLSKRSDIVVDTTAHTTNWTKPKGAKRVHVQMWGGGGAGGSRINNAGSATGGGGGAYVERWYNASDLSGTESYTVGAATNGPTNANSVGSVGSSSTFSSAGNLLTAFGGGGGGTVAATAAQSGGGGGGALSAGATGGGTPGARGGRPSDIPIAAGPNDNEGAGGASGAFAAIDGGYSFMGGAAGANIGAANAPQNGGNSVWGGGGGGGAASLGAGTGGTSANGGAGGGGATGAGATGVSGTQPSGGGGAGRSTTATVTGGQGAAGKIIITTYF